MNPRLRTFALAASLALGPALVAQEHEPAPAAQTQTTAPAPAHAAAPGEPAPSGHGQDAAAHHGPEVKVFGVSLGTLGQFFVKLLNFSIFAGLLVWLLKGALASAFKARAHELSARLSQAEKDKAEATAQLKELEGKMAGLQQELQGIMAKAEADAQAEKARVIEAARAEAEQILAQTRQEIVFQQRLAEQELRALVAELAVEGAAKRLEAQVKGAAADKLVDRAIAQVGGAK